MNTQKNIAKKWFVRPAYLILCLIALNGTGMAQEDTKATEEVTPRAKVKPVKNTFEGLWIIDNQTVMVPVKGTFEMDIMHRFGTVKNGYEDLLGFFAPSNIRMGFEYVPINNLMVGFSITKTNMTWEGYMKYALLKQTKGKSPVSVTYFGDVAMDTRKAENFVHRSDRFIYYNQLIIARKVTEKFSIQISPNLTHVNIVEGHYYAPGKYTGNMFHDHFAIGVAARYKLKDAMGLIINYDQPITKHFANNPQPNLAFGIELTTSAHAFQIFLGNYNSITPSRNSFYNQNDPHHIGQFLIGFNITRLWNY